MTTAFPSPPTTMLLLLLLLLPVTTPQPTSAPPPPYDFNPKFNPSMAIVVVVLITAFFFMGFFSIYLRQCGVVSDPDPSRRPPPTRRSAPKGLSPSTIESLPALVYSDVKDHKLGNGALECAVCLSEFSDDETLRLLPHCDHAFHASCIDAWLSSHTTCPVCRHDLAADDVDVTPKPPATVSLPALPPPDQVAVDVQEDPTPPPPSTGSRRGSGLLLPWSRSRSARTERPVLWSEKDRERFTLRLPEYVRREVVSGNLRRSVSVAVFAGEGSSRGGRGSWIGRKEWAAKSDRWAFVTRPLSFKFGGEGSTRRGEGSTRRGEGSRGKVLDCLVGGSGVAGEVAGGDRSVSGNPAKV